MARMSTAVNTYYTTHLFIWLYIHVSGTADTYLILRGDGPSQLFIPTESFRYVTWAACTHLQQDRLIFISQRHEKAVSSHTHRDKTLTAWTPHSSSSAWIFSPISETRGRIWHFVLCDQVTAKEVEGPLILDCYLWLTTWLVWPCCSVSTTWAFSGTGEAGWLWNLVMQLTKLVVSGPRKCYREQNPI